MKSKLFGTDGIRATVGEFPLTNKDLNKLGKAIGVWAEEKFGENPIVLLGHDTRTSCNSIKSTLKAILLQYNTTIYDAHVIPTPALVKLLQNQEKFDLAIMITASHNPYYDNGIKIIDRQTGKIGKSDTEKIENIFYSENSKNTDTEKIKGKYINFQEAGEKYINIVTSYFQKNFLQNIKIVLDCANGATHKIAPEIFKKLGAETIVIANKPDGKNINENCGSVHPEILQKKVILNKADMGFAFDGDGDRLTVINKNGEIKNGDDILCLLSNNREYQNQKKIVGTIVTNYGFENYLKNKNKNLIRTKVGDKFVCQAMKENNLLLGGEQSGHIVMKNYLCSGDGIFAALKIAETIKSTNNWKMKTFEKYPQITVNIPIKEKKDLQTSPFKEIITDHENKLKNGRIVIRYSGTEKVLRVMVEEEEIKSAKEICKSLSEKLLGRI